MTKQLPITRETVIREIQRVAKERGISTLSRSQFESATGISGERIYQLFEGWREACEVAGLQPHLQNVRLDDAVLFEEMRRVFLECGGVCTFMKFARLSKHSPKTYQKRFGRWQDILSKFHAWLEQNDVEFPYVQQLHQEIQTGVEPSQPPSKSQQDQRAHWKSVGGTTYGPFLNFRGLQHAPINEQGVVFLFGMVCFELGFVVEAVRTGYPDCEAKRRIHRQRDEWQRDARTRPEAVRYHRLLGTRLAGMSIGSC